MGGGPSHLCTAFLLAHVPGTAGARSLSGEPLDIPSQRVLWDEYQSPGFGWRWLLGLSAPREAKFSPRGREEISPAQANRDGGIWLGLGGKGMELCVFFLGSEYTEFSNFMLSRRSSHFIYNVKAFHPGPPHLSACSLWTP